VFQISVFKFFYIFEYLHGLAQVSIFNPKIWNSLKFFKLQIKGAQPIMGYKRKIIETGCQGMWYPKWPLLPEEAEDRGSLWADWVGGAGVRLGKAGEGSRVGRDLHLNGAVSWGSGYVLWKPWAMSCTFETGESTQGLSIARR
jgi:hypothetical protein